MSGVTGDMARMLTAAGFRGELRLDEPLSRHTSLKVGGPADLMAYPADRDDLLLLVQILDREGIPRAVIGGGNNLLVRDEGFRGCILSLARMDRLHQGGESGVCAEAGVSNQRLVAFARDVRRTGLEFLCSIPGTVGGALRMNAGAHGSAIMGVTKTVSILRGGEIVTIPRDALGYGYRYLRIEPAEVIVAAEFHLTHAPREEIVERIRKYREYRREHQPVTEPNAGSFFKNPPGESAWKLIDGAGLRGAQVGGARVSEAHANYLVNTGTATASDFLELAALIRLRVFERYGIQLEEEVRILPPRAEHP